MWPQALSSNGFEWWKKDGIGSRAVNQFHGVPRSSSNCCCCLARAERRLIIVVQIHPGIVICRNATEESFTSLVAVPQKAKGQRYEITDKIFQDNGPSILPAVPKYLTSVKRRPANSKQPREEPQKTRDLCPWPGCGYWCRLLGSPGHPRSPWQRKMWSCQMKLASECVKMEVFKQVNLFPED